MREEPTLLGSLVEAVARATASGGANEPEEGTAHRTAIEGFALLRSDHERRPNVVLYRPALCVVLQGAKRTAFGELRFECGPGEAVLVGIAAPAVGQVVQASPAEPYLGFVLELDLAILREVLETIEPPPEREGSLAGVFRVDFGAELIDCARRLVRLMETPPAIPVLAPALMREVCYWLLTGPQGGEVRRIARLSGPARAIVEALRLLRERFAEPVRVEDLARAANMSPSAFHLRFKELTATSPLQYQKRLRLYEARRLLIANEANVETAAFRVGYESPSQFSREYSRTFGLSPRRDAAALRSASKAV